LLALSVDLYVRSSQAYYAIDSGVGPADGGILDKMVRACCLTRA